MRQPPLAGGGKVRRGRKGKSVKDSIIGHASQNAGQVLPMSEEVSSQ
jgi:hypothetical protein